MASGSLLATFMVVFREALEASLIIGIILTVLVRLNGHRYIKHVLISVAAALGLSWVLGVWLAGLTAAHQETYGPMIEGVISLLAAAVLTYMFFWMEAQARQLKSEIETQVEAALSTQDYLAMVSLPFFAVLREGAETVLFLKAIAIQTGATSWPGAGLGLGLAVLIVLLIFAGGRHVHLKPLFRVTGIFILFMASGLLAYGVHELNEIHWIPGVIEPIYDINGYLSDKKGVGSFLKALFGYNGNPSLTETLAYWTFWGAILVWMKRSKSTGR